MGLLRTFLLVVVPFAVIAWRGYTIAEQAKDPFARCVAVGITTWITFQAFINIFVILALFPTTGVPLPFISYGGTAMVTLGLGLGILMSIARSRRLVQT
jgi:cell division protein FtsW (lipid II flippase)